MTIQYTDILQLRNEGFALTVESLEGLFEPEEHGLFVRSIHTACRRGFRCFYEVVDAQLLLRELVVGLYPSQEALAERGEGPVLFGVRPGAYDFGFPYVGLNAPMNATGGMLVGREFIGELYVHMGHHPPWKYRELRELIFDRGRLVEEYDRSEVAAELRGSLPERDLWRPGEEGRKRIDEWMREAFTRSYGP